MIFDADSDKLPKRSELQHVAGAPEGAAWFWGKDDEVCSLIISTAPLGEEEMD